jgi:hypothetical protein
VTLARQDVERILTGVLAQVSPAEFRLVGTASSVLRGIEVPAADVDLLFHHRAGVDAWFAALSTVLEVDTSPVWIGRSQQYFARLNADGVVIELSTVEVESDHDTIECFGQGPWNHFDVIGCGARTVPVVANELRLITEVGRAREDRYLPILEYLRAHGCDVPLVARGLGNLGTPPARRDQILTALSS